LLVARYYFHTNHPAQQDLQDDDEGFEFPTVHAAKCEAVGYASRLLCDSGEHFWDTGDFDLTVTDDKGLILFTMRVVGTEAPAIRILSKRSENCG
jgi:hypothetical protein